MQVFWSWQNDFWPKSCRHFIRDALIEAIGAAGSALGLEDAERPEIDHDTKGKPGMVDITATILEKISTSAAFVVDVTPVGKTHAGKALPNPNVMIELGWAMSKIGPDYIIPVLNEATGWKPDDLPFDIRHRRVLVYSLADSASKDERKIERKHLVNALTGALVSNLAVLLDAKSTSAAVRGVEAKEDDRSVWRSAGTTLDHSDSIGPGHKTTVRLASGPRGYIRIIPAGWTKGAPTVAEIGRLDTLWPASSHGSGNYGATAEGFVRYRFSGPGDDGQMDTSDVSMYFDRTGELWFLHGSAIGEAARGLSLRDQGLLVGWKEAMNATFLMFNRLGASTVRKVEVGLVGMRNVRWHGHWSTESPFARKDGFVHERQHRDWGAEAQLEFLTEAYSKVRDLFGLASVQASEVAKIVSP